MAGSLESIVSYLTHYTEALATVTAVDIEIIDTDFIRVAGTGVYGASIGQSIKSTGQQIYSYALSRHESVFIDDPKHNPLCQSCAQRGECREKLTFCTPIICSGKVIGLIGLVCFNDEDRDRIVAKREVYTYFFRQIANGIARVAETEETTRKLRRNMDMLLAVTNQDAACVLVLDSGNRISFINDLASRELGIRPVEFFQKVEITETSGSLPGKGEYEIRIADSSPGDSRYARHLVLGKLIPLAGGDPQYHRAMVFESKSRIARLVSDGGEPARREDALSGIIGESRVMQEMKEQVAKIASTSSTVLITGESGTGKEMFARAIHAVSNRREGPLIALNCGAIPDTLLESELFGYVGGAFTGASKSGRMGKFELADGGVLFLDEISSMPLYLQVKLLRVLQERSFSRLGSNKNVTVDIRIIAATNESIPQLIAQRMFREDLYYRLNVIPLEVPPLRERREDIPVLARHFLDRYCRLFDKPGMVPTPELLAALARYPWPGNVREFENCMEYMVNMHHGGVLDESFLPDKFRTGASSVPAPGISPAAASLTRPIVPLDVLEREAIAGALAVHGDSAAGKRRAAEALGISTATLYRKLKLNG